MKKRIIGLVCLLLSAAGALAASHWTVNPYGYQYDMTVYATLQIGTHTIADCADYEVAAFCGDECRGVAKVLTLDDGSKILYLRIYSNQSEGEIVSLKAYKPSTDKVILLPVTVDFVADSMSGTPDEPLAITVEDYILGDVNGNGGVDIGDAVSIVNYLVGKESTNFVEKAADTNKNGQVDIGDAVTIVNYLVGKTASLSRQLEDLYTADPE